MISYTIARVVSSVICCALRLLCFFYLICVYLLDKKIVKSAFTTQKTKFTLLREECFRAGSIYPGARQKGGGHGAS